MTGQLDINTLASWATVAVAAAGAAGFGRKASRWFEHVDERLEHLEERQAGTEERLMKIDAQLRPNGGKSHHDVIRREIREASHKSRWPWR